MSVAPAMAMNSVLLRKTRCQESSADVLRDLGQIDMVRSFPMGPDLQGLSSRDDAQTVPDTQVCSANHPCQRRQKCRSAHYLRCLA